MGLTSESTGKALKNKLMLEKQKGEYLVALAGNPNVGKSTVFNALTGMKQHTGNWAGKTVTSAVGRCEWNDKKYLLADIPGTYSLMANSVEEEAARDFICFRNPDAVIVVCDATCLERNLNLVLQILEITSKVVVCVNLMDEAKKNNISIDTKKLSEILGVPVVGVTARSGEGIDILMQTLGETVDNDNMSSLKIKYDDIIEEQLTKISEQAEIYVKEKLSLRWTAVRLLEGEEKLCNKICVYLDCDIYMKMFGTLNKSMETLAKACIGQQKLSDIIVCSIVKKAEEIADKVVKSEKITTNRDRKIDDVLTGRIWGISIMLGILGIIFWITAVGANYPSEFLSRFLFFIGDKLYEFLEYINCHETIRELTINGIYKVLAWVVSVMLPPMAIFFPLFTLLEDIGYLPRVAYNLDRLFKRSGACGKQALTMAMGLGCNAAGVTGCRIIESPRERIIAIITNCFMPCNGRFPTLITLISIFFTSTLTGALRFGVSALILLGIIVLAVLVTLFVSWILSKTVLEGVSSAFMLELPPYRKPQIGKVIVRSLFDRTVFVLGRACAVAAPSGLIIWILANVTIGNSSVLSHISEFLNPLGHILGMDGVILLGFLLGFPANEIVLPIILMCYMSSNTLMDISDAVTIKNILVENGWNCITAVCVLIFTVFHFPCSTTCLTVKKETGGIKYTMAAILIPTIIGIVLSATISYISNIVGG